MEMGNRKRVLKNTISLYFRTAVITIVSLYTSRVILDVLGIDDFGINNVVGGVVSMFGFITGTLADATQRYFSLDIANDDWKHLNKSYSVNLIIYLFFIVIIVILSETVGLWFVINKLSYESSRLMAVLVVYETSVVSFSVNMFVTPYIALLTADENLSIYSAVSIAEASLKLFIVSILKVISFDKLILYAIMTTVAGCAINMFYFYYAKRRYSELNFTVCKDKSEYKDVFSYQGWNFIGAIASVLKGQGVNIVINLFFGTAINAARGVALQVNSTINSFSLNYMKAVTPQITKAYGKREYKRFNTLIYSASKMTYGLLFIISVPVIFNAEYILKLWLVNVPDYTVIFVKMALIDALIECITDPIGTGVRATGKIKFYQIIVGGTLLLNVPISYILLLIFKNPIIPSVVSVVLSAIGVMGRIISIKKVVKFSISGYIIKVIFPIIMCTLVVTVVYSLIFTGANSLPIFVLNVMLGTGFSAICLFSIGLNRQERSLLLSFVKNKMVSFNAPYSKK